MDCVTVQEALIDYLEDVLEADERRSVEAHVVECARCRDHLSDAANLIDALRANSLSEPDHTSRPVDLIGQTLGDFKIEAEIGRGGMGVVYRACQVSLGRNVALKVLPGCGALHDAQAVRRFLTEAQAAAKLHHPHIVPVYAQGNEQGHLYYVMELVEGRPLSAVIDEHRDQSLSGSRGQRDLRAIAERVREVALALEYAHQCGVLHRDIKPANLMVRSDGAWLVTDFGLARARENPGVTMTGEMLGTPSYMSPEQIIGDPRGIDARVDVFALGVTLYEALTTKRPFEGSTRAEVTHRIQTDEPTPPRRVNPAIAVDLETICLRCLEKDRDRRFRSAGNLAAELQRFLEHRPIQSRRSSALARGLKWARRNPARTTAGVAVLAMLIAGWLGLWQWRQSQARDAVAAALNQILYESYRDYDAIEEVLDRASSLGASGASFELASGIAQVRSNPKQAAAHLLRATSLDPDSVAAHYALAWCQWWMQRFSDARKSYERGESLGGPTSAGEWFLRGLFAINEPELVDDAIASFKKAHDQRLEDGHTHYAEASLHYGRAVNYWMFRARDISSSEAQALFERRSRQAKAMFSAAATIRSEDSYPSYLLAVHHWLAGQILHGVDPPAARLEFKSGLHQALEAQQRGGALGYIIEGLIQESLGQLADSSAARTHWQHGIESLGRALEVATTDSKRRRIRDAYQYRWRQHLFLGDLESARADLEAFIRMPIREGERRQPHEGLWHQSLFGSVLRCHTDPEESRRMALSAAASEPARPVAVFASVSALWVMGDVDGGSDLLALHHTDMDWSLGEFPYEHPGWNEALYTFCMGQMDDDAWTDLEAVARGFQGDPSLRMAQAYFLAGARRAAVSDYDKAAQLWAQCVATHDYERYSALARTLLTFLRTSAYQPCRLHP
jgi:serine/threonine protein kinase